MMKLFSILFFVFLMVGINWSCYDNKDHDGCDEILNIQVTGIDSNIRVALSDILQIKPLITPADRAYRCFWGIADKSNEWTIIDTLSKEQNLEWKVDRRNGNYLLRFCAEDIETGIFSYTEYNLSVETDMTAAWWLLKSNGDNTDIDLFTPNKKITDIIYGRNGKMLAGEAIDMSYTDYFWMYDETLERDVMMKGVFVASQHDVVCLDFFTGKVLSDFEELFFEEPARKEIQSMFRGASDTHILIDNILYTMPNMKYAHYKQFVLKHLGDYELSVCRNASGWSLPLLFDRKSSSFCTVTRNSLAINYLGEGTMPAPHRNLNMDLLFIGARTLDVNRPAKDAYAILKSRGTDKYYLAHLLGTPKLDKNPMIKELKELSSSLGVVKADFRALNQDNDIIYYFSNNNLCSYDMVSGVEKKQSVNLPADEKITCMDYVKYFPWNQNDDWFSYLLIATVKNGNYKVYLHPVQAGNVRPAVKVLEGNGVVKRAIYIEMKEGWVNTSTYF